MSIQFIERPEEESPESPAEGECCAIVEPDTPAVLRLRPWYGYDVVLWALPFLAGGLIFASSREDHGTPPAHLVGMILLLSVSLIAIGWYVRRRMTRSYLLIARSTIISDWGGYRQRLRAGPEDSLVVEKTRSGKRWSLHWRSRPGKKLTVLVVAYPDLPEHVEDAMERLGNGRGPHEEDNTHAGNSRS